MDKMENVDLKNTEYLASFVNEWFDPEGPFRGLHYFQPIRVKFFRDGLVSANKLMNGTKILEVGCGPGLLTEALADLNATVVGIDPSDEMIAEAMRRHETRKHLEIEYFCETIESHSITNREKYDAVIVSEVMEHVVDKVSLLKGSVECLKPGGSIFVTTFNKSILSWIFGKIALEYVVRIIPIGTHEWKNFISPENTARILKGFGCYLIRKQGTGYQFWNNKCTVSSITSVHYALQAIKRCN